MLLETRLDDDTTILIDAEPSAGINKDRQGQQSPDMALENMLILAGRITDRLRETLTAEPPDEFECSFGVRVDGNAVVSIARSPGDGQFRVTARWKKSLAPSS